MSRKDHSIGRGIVAGLIGTVAYTAVSHAIKKRSGEAGRSTQPAAVAGALVGAHTLPSGPDPRLLNAALHWGYGAAGGVTRTMLMRRGLTGWRVEVAHLAAFWLPWRALLLAQRRKDGAARERLASLAVDAGKHVVYVVVAGQAYRALGGPARRP